MVVVVVVSSASGRVVAQPPQPDATDDPDEAPDPQFADGTPGQYRVFSQWPQPGNCGLTNCPNSPITLTYSFQNMFDGALKMPNGQPLPASLIRGSIEEALHLWASAAPLNFVEVPDDGLPYGSSTKFGQLRFRHIYINGIDPAVGRPVAKAQAYYPPGTDVQGDVEFDEGDRWLEVGTLHQPDILGAAIHEIGHTLGLAHSLGIRPGEYWSYPIYDVNNQVVEHLEAKGNANMFWIFTRYSGLGTGQLFPDDVAGIQAIYGTEPGSVTSLVTPEPGTLTLIFFAAATFFLRRRVR